jgi:predicted outer membrane protein
MEVIRDDVVDCANIGEINACFEKLLSEALMEMESAERALFSANSDAQSAAVEEDSIEKIVEARKVFIQSGLTHRSLKYVCDQFWDAFRHHREFHDDGRGSAADDNSGSGQPDTTD